MLGKYLLAGPYINPSSSLVAMRWFERSTDRTVPILVITGSEEECFRAGC